MNAPHNPEVALSIRTGAFKSNVHDPKLALAALDAATKATQYGARTGQVGGAVTFVVQLPGPAVNSAEWADKFHARTVEMVPATPLPDSIPAE